MLGVVCLGLAVVVIGLVLEMIFGRMRDGE